MFSWAINELAKEGLVKKVERGKYISSIPEKTIEEKNMAIEDD